jgi:hypothetical protein
MRITLNAEVFDEPYRLYGFFAERVCLTETNADDDWLRGNVALHMIERLIPSPESSPKLGSFCRVRLGSSLSGRDVRYWPIADIRRCSAHVCFRGAKHT